jgi:hypothetical protein
MPALPRGTKLKQRLRKVCDTCPVGIWKIRFREKWIVVKVDDGCSGNTHHQMEPS